MDGIVPHDTLPIATSDNAIGAPPVPAAPEPIVTETLYIQNLNERVKIDSKWNSFV